MKCNRRARLGNKEENMKWHSLLDEIPPNATNVLWYASDWVEMCFGCLFYPEPGEGKEIVLVVAVAPECEQYNTYPFSKIPFTHWHELPDPPKEEES
jgi:hypothetical protein